MRILFLSHGAKREGAPRSLYNIERCVRTVSDHEVCTVFATDGPMRREFARLGPTRVVPNLWPRRVHDRLPGLGGLVQTGVDRGVAAWLSRLGRPDLIVSNTVTNARLHRALARTGAPVLTRVAELDAACDEVPADDLAYVLGHSAGFIAVSRAVAAMLTDRFAVPPERISMLGGAIDVAATPPAPDDVARWRAAVGARLGDVVIGGIGRGDWWKGADRFVPMAERVARTGGAMRFVWLGIADRGTRAGMMAAAETAGIADRVRVLPPSPDPRTFFASIDILAVLSREDSSGLVMLEAAEAGVPTVCFRESRGPVEFVAPDCGVVVEPSDLDVFARAVGSLVLDAGRRARLGASARARLHAQCTLDVMAPRILEVLEAAV